MKISEVVRAMHPPRYTTAQAAALVGRSADTIRRWQKSGIYVPKHSKKFGKIEVRLYDDKDIAVMRKITKTIHPGPKTDVAIK